ncbi:VOC family protein [Pseudoalteromonas luteoviolacea]|uniref:VOC family protein n=1 Tax=Pseudoalteromonas luteoviolacea TaxID=43657 RepID=UPI001B374F59|nr:VOC family protein [Pseudoalteromonas luteoviolacea]MBQ4838706.1 VOC family protein [Pseudoalteromonas luteoviolacea]
MIGYVTLGTNDLQKGAKFYDELLEKIGATRFMEFETFISWSIDPQQPKLSITKPFDGKSATIGNGVMIALAVETPQQVDMLHTKALELGATDEGSPGPRGEHFYGAYFRDLDGNKLNFFCVV